MRKELNDLVATDLDPTLNPFSPITSEPLNTEEAMELETEILNEEGKFTPIKNSKNFMWIITYRTMDIARV